MVSGAEEKKKQRRARSLAAKASYEPVSGPSRSVSLRCCSLMPKYNQYRSIMVVVARLEHHSALVLVIVGVNICGLSYTN